MPPPTPSPSHLLFPVSANLGFFPLYSGRFRDAELATEGIHSSVQLLSLYHDLLLFRSSLSSSSTASKLSSGLTKSLHARYTRFWAAKSQLYRRVAIVLQVVQYTELLLEMWAKRRGEAVRWRAVVLIEAIKAFCRLLLLKITRSRPLVSPALPERERIPDPEEEGEEEEEDGKALAELMGENAEEQEHASHNGGANGSATAEQGHMADEQHDGANGNGAALKPNGNGSSSPPESISTSPYSPSPPNKNKGSSNNEWPMPRTGLTLPSLPTRGDISSYLLTRVLTADDIKPATKLLHALRGSAHTAEVLHILAPLIYAIALSRTEPSRRRSSWTPWLIGLSVQLAARQLAVRAREGSGSGGSGAAAAGAAGVPALEKEEWTRRGRQMWWWLMRGAAYENVVKGVVGGVKRRVPGFVGTILEDYEYLWENYHFSTSDS